MNRKQTKSQITALVAERAVEFFRAQQVARILRSRLNNEYGRYFAAHGEPERNRRRIDPDNPAYQGVIRATEETYTRYQAALRAKHSAKRRMESSVRALIGDDLGKAPIRRYSETGETLQ